MSEVVFCIKILGSVLVLLSGTMIGHLYGNDITLHYEELAAFKRYMLIMKSDINYGGYSLQEIIEHVRKQAKENHGNWLEHILDEIENSTNQRFELIWKYSIEKYRQDIRLGFNEIAELIEVGMSLGSTDGEQQMMMLTLYLNQLEYRMQMMEKDLWQKRKLYHLIGVAGSVFVIIILL